MSRNVLLLPLIPAALIVAAQSAPQPKPPYKIDGTIFHAQVLLDRAGFTPGVVDGVKGMSFEDAIRGFQEARGLKETAVLDNATRRELLKDNVRSTISIRITPEDAAGPFIGRIPKEPADKAKLERLGYVNLLEKIAEKFHTKPATIIALNGPNMRLGAGAVVRLPNTLPASRDYSGKNKHAAEVLNSLNVSPDQPRAAKIVVDKSDGVLRVFDKADKLIAQFPATMGSRHDPLPLGRWKIQGVSYNPDYKFNPDILRTAKSSDGKHILPPGPNSPVGNIWIDLSKEHYGIHGTPDPSTIGRAESNGCIRLTNWDAARLGQMVQAGTPAIFQP